MPTKSETVTVSIKEPTCSACEANVCSRHPEGVYRRGYYLGETAEEALEAFVDLRAQQLRFRVDVFCSGGWQYLASFAAETDAYTYGENYSVSGARVWDGDECIASTDGPRSWHTPKHNRDCDGKPCECGAVPPLGSMARGR